jgi:hypothetical protein
MGSAAYNRASKTVAARIAQPHVEKAARDELVRALEVALECEEFTRQAIDYIAEPRGLRHDTVERAKTRRGWAKRHAALVKAHNAWVDCGPATMARHALSVRRAQAAFQLLDFALGGWTLPSHIRVPRAARS